MRAALEHRHNQIINILYHWNLARYRIGTSIKHSKNADTCEIIDHTLTRVSIKNGVNSSRLTCSCECGSAIFALVCIADAIRMTARVADKLRSGLHLGAAPQNDWHVEAQRNQDSPICCGVKRRTTVETSTQYAPI